MSRSMLAAPLLAIGALGAFGAQAGVVDIDNVELARLSAAGVPVIDIRTAAEWRESGVIAGSHLLTFFDANGRADPPAWLNRVKAVASMEQPVIVICRSGNRTRPASQFLSTQGGYRTVYNVARGIRAWAAEGRALAPVSSVAGSSL